MTQLALNDMPYEATCLADDLVDGNPAFGWKGDARLELRVGVLTAAKTGTRKGRWYKEGELMARQYQVWRHNEDGTDKRLVSRPLHLLHEILPELVRMDPRTPGHVGTMELVEKNNAKVDADKAYAIGQAQGEMIEHLWSVAHDRSGPKHTFRGMPGSNPDRQL